MDTTVTLNSFVKYGVGIVVLLFALVVIVALIYFRLLSKTKEEIKNAKKAKKELKIVEPTPSVKQRIINKYSKELSAIHKQFINHEKSGRECYQLLSKDIRRFAREMTGVDISVYTLEEIKLLKFPVLEELIENCYKPEFSAEYENMADETFEENIEKTLKVMKKWK